MRVELISEGVKGIIGPNYHYSNQNGAISLVYASMATMDMYEIFCLDGNHFEDIERFKRIEDAVERIEYLLGEATEENYWIRIQKENLQIKDKPKPLNTWETHLKPNA